MKNSDVKIKVGLNFHYFIGFSTGMSFVLLILFALLKQIIEFQEMDVFWFVYIPCVYFLSLYYVKKIKFYDDRIEYFYPTRLWERHVIVFYIDIDRVIYARSIGNKAGKEILIKKRGEYFSYLFTIRKYEKLKDLLLFLDSKGLNIVIKSINDADYKILKKRKKE